MFPIADGTVKLSGGDQVLRTSTLIRDSPDRGEEQRNLLDESDGSFTIFPGSSPAGYEKKRNSVPFRRTTFTVITLNRMSNCTCSPHLLWKCAQVTGKAGENGQNSGEMGGSSPWTRPSAPGCGDTLKAPAGDQRLVQGGDRPRRRLRGRYRLGHRPVVLTHTETAQCTVRPT